jgi:hypothetical protein
VTYELWDVATGNCIGRFGSEVDALARVRTLLDQFGDGYAEDLELGVEDDSGTFLGSRTGALLVAQVGARPLPREVSTRRAG